MANNTYVPFRIRDFNIYIVTNLFLIYERKYIDTHIYLSIYRIEYIVLIC